MVASTIEKMLLATALLLLCGDSGSGTWGIGVLMAEGTFAYTGKCDEYGFDSTGLALTADLYKQGYDAYKDAVCIPNGAFCFNEYGDYCPGSPGMSFKGNVTLENMNKLVYVGERAFARFQGKLTIQGSFSSLKVLGKQIFYQAIDLVIKLDSAAVGALEVVESLAFDDLTEGSIISANGIFPNLKTCFVLPGGDMMAFGLALTPDLYKEGYDAYKDAVCVPDGAFSAYKGDLALGNMDRLIYVGVSAFRAFAGKLTIQGPFPKWREIGDGAFRYAGTADSVIALDSADVGNLAMVGELAFQEFKGTVSAKGTFPNLQTCEMLPGGETLAFGLALTPDLYKQGYAVYKDAVCIPNGAFCGKTGADNCYSSPGPSFEDDLTLKNMDRLIYVGYNAFAYFTGKLTIQGSFPKWREIGHGAFQSAGTADSVILLDGTEVSAMEVVGGYAFDKFKGKLTIQGPFSKWREIGTRAFISAGNAASSITLNGAEVGALQKVGMYAFGFFPGKLTIQGPFPKWREIGDEAFNSAGTADSLLAIQCRGETWYVGTQPFIDFVGVHNVEGEKIQCSALYCNGKLDPSKCQGAFKDQCDNPVLGADAKEECPIMCSTCIDVTTVTTAAATTITALCNGKSDLPTCVKEFQGRCNEEDLAETLSTMCPVMCGTCVTTTSTATNAITMPSTTITVPSTSLTTTTLIASTTTTSTITTTTSTTATTLTKKTTVTATTTTTIATSTAITMPNTTITVPSTSLTTTTLIASTSTTSTITTTTSTTATTLTKKTTVTAATTTTTVYDPGNVDCAEQQDNCTAVCEVAGQRNYTVTKKSAKKGKKCNGSTDCKPGDGQCPENTTTATTTTTTPTNNATTSTTLSADVFATKKSLPSGGVVAIVIITLLLIGGGFAAWYKGCLNFPACLNRQNHTLFANDDDVKFDDPAVADMFFLNPMSVQQGTLGSGTVILDISGAMMATSSTDDPISPDVTAAGAAAITTTTKSKRRLDNKFLATSIRLGRATQAADGLADLMGFNDMSLLHYIDGHGGGIESIMYEIATSGTRGDKKNLKTLLDGTYTNPPDSNGALPTPEELVAQSMTIDELMQTEEVKTAKLQRAHVLSLRLYTTSTYTSMNNPLRTDPATQPHPLAATVFYASQGIKKLRSVAGNLPSAHEPQDLWRGIKDMTISDAFFKSGGTEFACMSTSLSRDIAIDFAFSKAPMIIKLETKDFMSRGADISFLSVYPGEGEVLFPPLTFLRPIGRESVVMNEKEYLMVRCEPVIP